METVTDAWPPAVLVRAGEPVHVPSIELTIHFVAPLPLPGAPDDDFYLALNLLLYDLGDEHSYFQSPEEVAEADAAYAGNADFVGIGVHCATGSALFAASTHA